jgi:nicotinate dehydrogenase subunit B
MSITEGQISRRAFIGGTGALIVSFTVPGLLNPGDAVAKQRLPPVIPPHYPAPSPTPPITEGPSAAKVDSWLKIAADGQVTIFSGKAELGTGTSTSTLQMVADQLGVSMEQLSIVQPDTALTVDQTYTAGSQTLKTQWAAGVRQAAASARMKLLELASAELGAPVSKLRVADGVVSLVSDSSHAVSYGHLIGNKKFDIRITAKTKVEPPSRREVVGKSVDRIDIPAKVKAQFFFMQDIRVPGMLHGRVVRPPALDATLVSVDTKSLMPGVVKIVVKHNFIGVVADTESQAIAAAAALKPKWKLKPLPDESKLYDTLRNTKPDTKRVLVETLVNGGAVPEALAQSPHVVRATYHYPYQLHAPIGPPCAIADVQSDRVMVWSGTQGVYPLRDTVAQLLGRKPNTVRVTYVEASGCYGLDGEDGAALDAALMSEAVGHPVRVQYMRADAHAWENFGQAMVMEAAAGLDPSGQIIAWDYRVYAASRGGRPAPPGNILTGGLVGLPPTPNPKSPPPSPPLGPDSSNAVTNYDVPRSRVISLTVPSRFYTGPLRSPTRIQNTFANESFIDELASSVAQDPIAFRLKHLSDPRLIAVIKEVSQMAGWQPAPAHSHPGAGSSLSGRGIAAMRYEGTGGYAGVIVHIDVDTGSGAIKVRHVWTAQDCGLAVNPEGMRAQAEGCCIQGISRALKEELKWTPDQVTSRDWVSYPILTFSEMPDTFDWQVINRPDQPVLGAGEVVITAMVAAIANAVHDATGIRVREVPFTPARVKAALKAA